MAGEQSEAIRRFEAWLKPGLFYLFLALLILLNLMVWFGWKPLASANTLSEVVASLRAERDRLQGLLGEACTSAGLEPYRRGEAVSPPAVSANGPEAAVTPPNGLVGVLQSAAVVVVHPEGSGSGFFIDPTTIVTNRHVIEGVKSGTVLIANKTIGTFLKAKIVSVTRGSSVGSADFALLRLEQSPAGIKVLPIAGRPEPLQPVVAVGFPGSVISSDQGSVPAPIYTAGDVSVVQPQATGVALVIHTAEISPGSSGGALVDRCGSAVGVNTFVRSPENTADGRRLYALSADSLRKFLEASGQRYTNAGACQADRAN